MFESMVGIKQGICSTGTQYHLNFLSRIKYLYLLYKVHAEYIFEFCSTYSPWLKLLVEVIFQNSIFGFFRFFW